MLLSECVCECERAFPMLPCPDELSENSLVLQVFGSQGGRNQGGRAGNGLMELICSWKQENRVMDIRRIGENMTQSPGSVRLCAFGKVF